LQSSSFVIVTRDVPSRDPRARRALFWSAGAISLALLGCSESPLEVGQACSSDRQCITRLCDPDICLNPLADDDGDGVPNAREAELLSNAADPDTDGDGRGDRDELGEALAALDTDGDSKLDILESRVLDADGDCIVDEMDARDGVFDEDKRPIAPLVCRVTGLCAERADAVVVRCDPVSGAASCDYDAVPGFAPFEARCDGIDEDCDGVTDEGFLDRNQNGVADCAERRRRGLNHVGVVGGTGEAGDEDVRMRIIVGRPVLGPGAEEEEGGP
jgi:hypothetical protein